MADESAPDLNEPVKASDLVIDESVEPRQKTKRKKAPGRKRGRPTNAEKLARQQYEWNQTRKVKAADKKRRAAVEGFCPGAPPWAQEYPLVVGNETKAKRLTKGEYASIRYAASLHFITDMNGCTVADMCGLPQFAIIPVSTMQSWCDQDKWVERRHQNLSRWRGMIEEKIGDSLVQQKAEDLNKLTAMFNQAIAMVTPNDKGYLKVEPNSWEGVANTAMKLGKQMNEWRAELTKQLTPTPKAIPEEHKVPALPGGKKLISPAEARDVAHMILSRRHRAENPDVIESKTSLNQTKPDKSEEIEDENETIEDENEIYADESRTKPDESEST